MAKTVCIECEKVYDGGPKSFFCPECRKKRILEGIKRRDLKRQKKEEEVK